MKFNDIPIGQRFELEGAIYVKSSPMLASPEAGGASRFLARYVQVQPLDVTSASPRKAAEQLLRMADALDAFDVFYELCRTELLPDGERQEKLRAGREIFVAALERRALKP
jgi:hypothetical protein